MPRQYSFINAPKNHSGKNNLRFVFCIQNIHIGDSFSVIKSLQILLLLQLLRSTYADNSNELKLINTQDEKIDLFEKFNIDHVIVCPFTIEFSRMTSVEFVKEILVKNIGIKKLIIGYDHHFGRNREGSIEELQEFSELYDFEIEEVQAKLIGDVKVSSTKIRKALEEGKVKTAGEYLGYKYSFIGKVIEGDKIGRTINFPTANLDIIGEDKIIPRDGVYAVKVKVKNTWHKGMLNIGVRPTLNGSEKRIEVNIFDFDHEIYHIEIKIAFVRRIRDEMKFESLEKLSNQLSIDKEMTLALLK